LDQLRLTYRALRHGRAIDRDLAREIEAHLADQIDEHVARGLPPDEARRQALRQFGGRTGIEEACRESRGVSLVENLARDLRYGWRALVHQPMLLAVSVASIALGAGANLGIYALANDLLLSAPSATRPESLVHVRTGNGSHVSYPAWRHFGESAAVAGLAGYNLEGQLNWRSGDTSLPVTPLVVTPDFFEVVGVPVALGKGFTPDDVARDPRVVVIADSFRRRLDGTADVVGQTLILNGEPYSSGAQGSVIWEASADAVEVRTGYYGNLGCFAPGYNARIALPTV
jgi:hypothetical protein